MSLRQQVKQEEKLGLLERLKELEERGVLDKLQQLENDNGIGASHGQPNKGVPESSNG